MPTGSWIKFSDDFIVFERGFRTHNRANRSQVFIWHLVQHHHEAWSHGFPLLLFPRCGALGASTVCDVDHQGAAGLFRLSLPLHRSTSVHKVGYFPSSLREEQGLVHSHVSSQIRPAHNHGRHTWRFDYKTLSSRTVSQRTLFVLWIPGNTIVVNVSQQKSASITSTHAHQLSLGGHCQRASSHPHLVTARKRPFRAQRLLQSAVCWVQGGACKTPQLKVRQSPADWRIESHNSKVSRALRTWSPLGSSSLSRATHASFLVSAGIYQMSEPEASTYNV